MDAETTTETVNPEVEAEETTDTESPDLAAEVEKWKNLSRKHEERAKANANAAKELNELRQSTLSETERAIELAKAEARSQTLREMAVKVVEAKLQAELSGRTLSADAVLSFDKASFINEDGEVDDDSIKAWVESHSAKAEPVYPDLAQGKRGTSVPLNSDPLLADLKAKLGIN